LHPQEAVYALVRLSFGLQAHRHHVPQGQRSEARDLQAEAVK
jgi:hypothetical protein